LLLNTIHHPPPPPCFFVLTAPHSFCLYSHVRLLIRDTKTSKLGLRRGIQKNSTDNKKHTRKKATTQKKKTAKSVVRGLISLSFSLSLSLKVVSTDRSRGEKTFKKGARRGRERAQMAYIKGREREREREGAGAETNGKKKI